MTKKSSPHSMGGTRPSTTTTNITTTITNVNGRQICEALCGTKKKRKEVGRGTQLFCIQKRIISIFIPTAVLVLFSLFCFCLSYLFPSFFVLFCFSLSCRGRNPKGHSQPIQGGGVWQTKSDGDTLHQGGVFVSSQDVHDTYMAILLDLFHAWMMDSGFWPLLLLFPFSLFWITEKIQDVIHVTD